MSNDKLAATFHGADEVVDLMGALKASIDRARETRRAGERVRADLQREQDLRAHVTDLLTDVDHFNGCPGGTDTCRCLIGRLNWAINAEEVTS